MIIEPLYTLGTLAVSQGCGRGKVHHLLHIQVSFMPADTLKFDVQFAMRSAKVSDVPALLQLVEDAYRGGKATVAWKNEHDRVTGPRTSKNELSRYITSTESSILVLESGNGTFAGCVCVEKQGADAHIGLLAVNPSFQNQGVGRRLLEDAESYGQAQFGCTSGVMWVLSGRDELLEFYRRRGYEKTGETVPFPAEEYGVTLLKGAPLFTVIRRQF